MANTIRLKRGTTEPVAGNLVTGELAINTGDATVYTKLDDGTVTPIVGKSNNLFVSVRNESGSAIPAFSAVYINGASSNKPTIVLAQANSELTSSKTLGFTTAAINHNKNGEVITNGLLTKVDTQAYSAGASLWLSPTTPGGVTTTMPTAPNHAVFLGTVVTSASNGKVEVKVQNGYELQELHNVSISSPAAGDVLGYDSVNSLWKNLSGYATQSWVSSQGYLTSSSLSAYAPLSSPVFTGDPRSVTPATSDNDTSIATTAFVKAQGYLTTAPVTSVAGRTGAITLAVADVSGAAARAGDTFTGKVNFTSVEGAAGLNIGIGGVQTTATTPGDMWIATGGTILNYRDGTGAWRQVLTTNNAGSITVNSSTLPALRLTQQGTAPTFVVEDSTTPDTSSLVVDASGNVGVGVSSTWTGTAKLEVQGVITTTTAAYADTSLKAATTAFVKSAVAGSAFDLSSNQSWALGYNGAPNHLVRITDGGADGTVVIPTSPSGIPAGAQWVFIQQSSYSMTFQTDGGGAVLNSFTGQYTTGGTNAVVTLIYIGNDTWHLAGNLA
jgi:hypothetical protein